MQSLSDELLLESYRTALKLNLSEDFLVLMKKEIDKRNLALKMNHTC